MERYCETVLPYYSIVCLHYSLYTQQTLTDNHRYNNDNNEEDEVVDKLINIELFSIFIQTLWEE